MRTVANFNSTLGKLVENDNSFYLKWIETLESPSYPPNQFPSEPLPIGITLLVIVTDNRSFLFEQTFESIISQCHETMKTIVVIGKNSSSHKIDQITNIITPYNWATLITSEKNRPADLWNSGLKNIDPSSEHACMIESGEVLSPNSIRDINFKLNDTRADFLYADHDHIYPSEIRHHPYFKPDFSPDLLHDVSYISVAPIFKTKLISQIEPCKPEYHEATKYEFVLRLIEKSKTVSHLSSIICHSPKTAYSADTRSYHREAYTLFLKRKYGDIVFFDTNQSKHASEIYPKPLLSADKTFVSIIIPVKDRIDLTSACISSILNTNSTLRYEILILNNNSKDILTFEWFEDIQKKNKNIKVIEANYPFNWSKLNNHGISIAEGNLYIFLNNDTTIVTTDWLERLACLALKKDAGIVYPQLLYPDYSLQHAGVVIGLYSYAGHIYHGTKNGKHQYYFTPPSKRRNVLAGTGACMAISKRIVNTIGNFDEKFQISGSDIEIGVRAYNNGYYNIYDSNTVLVHHESKTRSSKVPISDIILSKKHFEPFLSEGDPFFNRNFKRSSRYPMLV